MEFGIDLLIGVVALAFGIFTAVSPAQSAELWGARRLSGLDSRRRTIYLRTCRIFGGFLSLAGILVMIGGLFHWD